MCACNFYSSWKGLSSLEALLLVLSFSLSILIASFVTFAFISHLSDFQNLHEAFLSLENGKVNGIMEELFTGIEFINNRSNLGPSIAEVFEINTDMVLQ